jgi:hypothetical protein
VFAKIAVLTNWAGAMVSEAIVATSESDAVGIGAENTGGDAVMIDCYVFDAGLFVIYLAASEPAGVGKFAKYAFGYAI